METNTEFSVQLGHSPLTISVLMLIPLPKKDSELFKDKATSAKNLATNNKGVAGMKNLTSKVLDKIEKHGAAKVAKYITKKLGWKIAARTLAKGALGLAGLATGGLATAAMAAWSAKDLYDVANAVSEMD